MKIDPTTLGCVMLDVVMPDLTQVIDPEWAYTSPDPAQYWVSGVQTQGHATLLYGLLAGVTRVDVDEVLDGWRPQRVVTDKLTIFSSPTSTCVVAEADPLFAASLVDAHQRLSRLPHVNLYPVYRPHVTLAYVQEQHAGKTVEALREFFSHQDSYAAHVFPPLGLNYGEQIR